MEGRGGNKIRQRKGSDSDTDPTKLQSVMRPGVAFSPQGLWSVLCEVLMALLCSCLIQSLDVSCSGTRVCPEARQLCC